MNKQQKEELADSLSSALEGPRRRQVAALDTILKDYVEPEDRQQSPTGNPVSQSPTVGTQSPNVGSHFVENRENPPNPGTQSPALATQSPTPGDWEPSLPVSQSPNSLLAGIEAGYPSRQERTKKGWRIRNDQLQRLSELCYILGVDEQDMVEEGLTLLFGKYFDFLGTQSPSLPGGQSPSLPVNSIHELTKNNLIRLYEELAARRWDTMTDEQHYATIAHVPAEAIELGIRLSKQRADKARSIIRTFKYCLGAITEAEKMDLIKRRQRLERMRFEQR